MEADQCGTHSQEGLEGGQIQELQVCQPDLSAGQGYGADPLECDHKAPTGQLAVQEWEMQVLPDQPDLRLQLDESPRG